MVEIVHTKSRASIVAMAVALCIPAVACGASPNEKIVENPGASPAPSASAPRTDEGNRPLSESECNELGQWIVQACNERGNQRSTQIEGYCTNMTHGMADATWVAKQCLPRIRHMDAVCIKSTDNIRKIIDCERSVTP